MDVANDDDDVPLDDLAAGLRRLGAYAVTALTLLAIAWIWEVDMALLQFLLNQPLWARRRPDPGHRGRRDRSDPS